MKIKIYQVDAFTDELFGGNPAAVCPLEEWLSDDLLQNIAMENNLSETAFYVKDGDQYQVRWFTPTVEVDLCGHATFAAAFVLFHHEGHSGEEIQFISPRSGELHVTRNDDQLTLNFPADHIEPVEITQDIFSGFDIKPHSAYKGQSDILLIFDNEQEIKTLKPNFAEIAKLDARGVIVTAKGNDVDFVSRFFGPQVGVNEDPVTGSAHTTLTSYWAQTLNKESLSALQLSKRGGALHCKLRGKRVDISGQGTLYMSGEIHLST
jgi:PhzF family phenazine biosynthesis protein